MPLYRVTSGLHLDTDPNEGEVVYYTGSASAAVALAPRSRVFTITAGVNDTLTVNGQVSPVPLAAGSYDLHGDLSGSATASMQAWLAAVAATIGAVVPVDGAITAGAMLLFTCADPYDPRGVTITGNALTSQLWTGAGIGAQRIVATAGMKPDWTPTRLGDIPEIATLEQLNVATGPYAFAHGVGSDASGFGAAAFGVYSQASSEYSVVTGVNGSATLAFQRVHSRGMGGGGVVQQVSDLPMVGYYDPAAPFPLGGLPLVDEIFAPVGGSAVLAEGRITCRTADGSAAAWLVRALFTDAALVWSEVTRLDDQTGFAPSVTATFSSGLLLRGELDATRTDQSHDWFGHLTLVGA